MGCKATSLFIDSVKLSCAFFRLNLFSLHQKILAVKNSKNSKHKRTLHLDSKSYQKAIYFLKSSLCAGCSVYSFLQLTTTNSIEFSRPFSCLDAIILLFFGRRENHFSATGSCIEKTSQSGPFQKSPFKIRIFECGYLQLCAPSVLRRREEEGERLFVKFFVSFIYQSYPVISVPRVVEFHGVVGKIQQIFITR